MCKDEIRNALVDILKPKGIPLLLLLSLFLLVSESVSASSITMTHSGAQVNFGDVSPGKEAKAIPCAAQIVVNSNTTWDLTVKANSDLLNIADSTKSIPVSRLEWMPHSESSSNWTAFQTTLQSVLSDQAPTDRKGKIITCDYRFHARWSDPPGSYRTTVTYTVTTGDLEMSFASPNPFSPNGDGVDDTTLIWYKLDDVKPISVTILDTNYTRVRTLVSDSIQSLGSHSIVWDGKNDSSIVVTDGQYIYLVQDSVSTQASGLIIVDTKNKRKTSGFGTIQGQVTDAKDNRPLFCVSVELYDSKGELIDTTYSDYEGIFSFDQVGSGSYFLTAHLKYYYSQTSKTFFLSDDETVRINVQLTHNKSLFITKSADVFSAAVGDVIRYTITVENTGTADLTDVEVKDILPHNFKYIAKTSYTDGEQINDPKGINPCFWRIGDLPIGKSVSLTYHVLIGIDAVLGDQMNIATASGLTDSGMVFAGPASAVIRISEGLFSDRGVIIGKVYNDLDGNGVQGKEEKGIGKIGLILEDGTQVITDKDGRYAIPNINSGDHILMVDESTLPTGVTLITQRSKYFNLTRGGLEKVNFRILSGQNNQIKGKKSGQQDKTFVFVGLAEGQVGHLSVKGNKKYFNAGDSGFNSGYRRNARFAFFMKSKLGKKLSLTAAFDTGKDEKDKIFRRIEPEKYYPVYGDESSLADNALNYGKLQARLDYGKSYLSYGNYSLRLTGTELSGYQTPLTGVKAHYQVSKLNFTLFGSSSQLVAVREEIKGEGVGGPYYLKNYPLAPYTEQITIELHHLEHNYIISYEEKNRDLDYTIDYQTGRIVFTKPIPSQSIEGNPYYIVVNYQYYPIEKKNHHYIYGFRGTIEPLSNLTLGSTYLTEEQAPQDYQLFGVDLSFRLSNRFSISSEYAFAKGDLLSKSYSAKVDKHAYTVQVILKPMQRLNLKTFYRQIGVGFDNDVRSISLKGIEEFKIRGLDFYNITNPSTAPGVEEYGIKGDYRITDCLAFRLQHKKSYQNVISYSDSTATIRDISSFGLQYDIPKWPTFFFNHEIEKRANDLPQRYTNTLKKTTTIGAFRSFKKLAFETKYSLGDYTNKDNPRENTITETGLVKLSLKTFKNISPNIQYQISSTRRKMENIMLTKSNSLILGTKVRFNSDLSTSISFEFQRVHDYSWNEIRDGWGASWKLGYSHAKKLNGVLRYDIKRATGSPTIYDNNLTCRLEYKPSKSLTTLADLTYRDCREQSFREIVYRETKTLLCLAYRPTFSDQLNLLTKFETRQVYNIKSSEARTPINTIVSTEFVYNPWKKITLFEKYALKKGRNRGLSSITDLIITRLIYDLNDHFDVTGEYRVLHQHNYNDYKNNSSIEAGYSLIENIRLALGFASIGYHDGGFSTNSYFAKGFYLRLTGKLGHFSYASPNRN